MALHMFPQPEEWWTEEKELLWKLDDPDHTPTEEELEKYHRIRGSSDTHLTRKPRSFENIDN